MAEENNLRFQGVGNGIAEVDVLILRGQLDDAEKSLLAMHKRNPDFADICNKMGQLYFQKGDYLRAKEFLARAVRLNPDYTEASLNLAVTYNEIGKYEEARKVVDRARERVRRKKIPIDPFIAGKLANKHKEVGDIYRELGLMQESVDEYRKALTLSPGFADIQVKLGIALREMGRIDEALDIFSTTAIKRPDYLDARIQLGITYFSRGFVDRAQDEWEEVLRLDPQYSKALMYLSFIREQEDF
ncbi:MAG: tetratricopeptide repeat protein [Deltaproteobacteria bacterium]|nr:tetratricopeptide repeat protein [Deltaproteobacteria bacterium]